MKHSLNTDIQIERGSVRDWLSLSHLHYRGTLLGPVDSIYRLTEGGELAGVVVYAYPSAHSSVRNSFFSGRYSGTFTARERRMLLNREIRVVRRIVTIPRLRGRGLASELLRVTLPLLDIPFVECVSRAAGSSMFLERAGFARLARTSSGNRARPAGRPAPFYYLWARKENRL